MSALDKEAGAQFVSEIERLASQGAVVHPRECFWDDFQSFIETEKSRLLNATYRSWSDYAPAIVLLIADQSPDLLHNMTFRAKTRIDSAANLLHGLSPKGKAAPEHASRILFWLLSLHPNHPSTLSIERKVFRGKTFEEFFGFPLPQEGEQARSLYNQWKTKNLSDDLTAEVAGEAELAIHHAENQTNNPKHDEETPTGETKGRYSGFKHTVALLLGISIIGMLAAIFHEVIMKEARNAISDLLTDRTIRMTLESFPISRIAVNSHFFKGEAENEPRIFLFPVAEPIFDPSTYQGFNDAELVSKITRSEADIDWPFQYLSNGSEKIYGRPDDILKEDGRFLKAYYLDSYAVECPSIFRLRRLPSNFHVGHPDCTSAEILYRQDRDWLRTRIDFSERFRPLFSPNTPVFDAVSLEVSEFSGGFFAVTRMTSPSIKDTIVVSKNNFGARTDWGVVFEAEAAQAFEIGRASSRKSVLVHAEHLDDHGSTFIVLNHATGSFRFGIDIKERVSFFDVNYSGRSDTANLIVATDADIYEFSLSYQEPNGMPEL